MTKLAGAMCWFLAWHALLSVPVYLVIGAHVAPANPLWGVLVAGFFVFQSAVAIAVWCGIRFRVGGLYPWVCRACLRYSPSLLSRFLFAAAETFARGSCWESRGLPR